MKHQLFSFLFLSLVTYSFGQQKLPYVGPNQIFIFPNATNKFINSASINWALDIEESYSFADSKKIENQNIYNLIISKALSGELKAYELRHYGFEGYENAVYSEYDKVLGKNFTNLEKKIMLSDSLKTIKFHEIFFLNNYRLSCQIVAAAPLTNYATTGGINLGLQEIFFCCKNTKDSNSTNKKLNFIHLKRIERTLNIDSIQDSKIVKQTYGFNLAQSIWYGASQGFIKLIDLKKNQVIASKNVMNYSYLDSVKVPVYDSTGSVVRFKIESGQAVFPYKLTGDIQFTQDLYYDLEKNVFTTTISDCHLFVKNWDDVKSELIIEKRFKVL